jgi:hypothetical protein
MICLFFSIKVSVERGMCWEKALDIYNKEITSTSQLNSDSGFYISNQTKNNHRIAILATMPDLSAANPAIQNNQTTLSSIKCQTMAIYRPNISLQNKLEALDSILKKYKKATPDEARQHWCEQYEKSARECTHLYRQGHCGNIQNCEIGLRTRTFHILAGSVLTVWSKVESLVSTLLTNSSHQYRLQIIRVKTNDNQKIVGCVIPNRCLRQIDSLLSAMSFETRVQQHSITTSENNLDINKDSTSDTSGLTNSSAIKKEEEFIEEEKKKPVENDEEDVIILGEDFNSGDFFDFDFKTS